MKSYDDYSALWKSYESIMAAGKNQDALNLVDSIFGLAVQSNNDVQILKTFFNRYNATSFQEDHIKNHIIYTEFNLSLLSTETGKAVCYSYLSELYRLYLTRNSYKLRNSTNVTSSDYPLELSDYSMSQLIMKANEYLYLSLEQDDSKNTPVDAYSAVIENVDSEGKKFRNTIYDLLSFRAIQYFTSGNNFLPESLDQFSLFQEEAFAKSERFIEYDFTSAGDSSAIREAIMLYQGLERSANGNPEKLNHYELSRLQFTYQNSTNPQKSEFYEASLIRLFESISNSTQKAEAGITLVKHLIQMGSRELGKIESKNRYFVDAMKYLNDIEGADKNQVKVLEALQENIEAVVLNLVTERVYPVDQDFPVLIRFRNTKKVEAKIYELSDGILKEYYENQNSGKPAVAGRLIKSFTIDLPIMDDYDQSSYEYVLDALPSGNYILELNSSDRKISAHNLFHVSSIAAIRIGDQLQIVNRNTGSPIRAKVELYSQRWERRRSVLEFIKEVETDEDGRVSLGFTNQNVIPKIITKTESLFTFDNIYNYDRRNNTRDEHIISFTDRSIYRPGQSVFYKAILYNNNLDNVLPNQQVKIELYDANYQVIESKTLKTNEFGSVNGEFKIPKDILNGQFTIKYNCQKLRANDSKSIRVEEYKRPTYKVEFDELKSTYSFGKKISFVGNLNSYNGTALANQEVTFTIERNQVYRWYYSRYYSPAPTKIIANGTVVSDASGKFIIDFIPELPKTKQQYNSFSYKVKAKVTDSRGETRTSEYTVVVSDKEFVINTDKNTYTDQDEQIEIFLRNQNGNAIEESISVSVFKLKDEKRFFVDKLWEAEFQALEKAEYYERTKYYPYKKENEMENMDVIAEVDNKSLEIDSSTIYSLKNLEQGIYKFVLSSPKADTITLYLNKDASSYIGKEVLNVTAPAKVKVTDDLTVKLVSMHSLNMYSYEMRQQFKEARQAFTLATSLTKKYDIAKADKGGISIRYFTYHNNRFHSKAINVNVIDPLDKLTLNWETIRSELYPGSEEKWRLKILDNNNNVVQSELVASMYDKSLDAFLPHSWGSFYEQSTLKYLELTALGVGTTYSRINNTEKRAYPTVETLLYPFLYTRIGLLRGVMRPSMRGSRSLKSTAARPSGVSPEANMSMEMEESFADQDDSGFAAARVGDTNKLTETYIDGVGIKEEQQAKTETPDQFIRTNLNETVFFKPELVTNAEGDILVEFTMNEALTEWRLMAFGHTKKLQSVFDEQVVQTKKDLMVFPNGPRFFRIGDKITIPTEIRNLTENTLLAEAKLQIFDLLTDEDVSNQFITDKQVKKISVEGNSASNVKWEINVPGGIEGIRYQISATSADFKDGEEKTALVVDNRKLVTESKIYVIDGKDSQQLATELKNDNTIDPKNYSISVISNPSWMAVQSLPYLMEYRYTCTEQIFSRYFSNALAKHVMEENPEIESVYKEWSSRNQLKSPLSKNEELKYALLEQSPWVQEAQGEEEQMQQLAYLFDTERVQAELASNQRIIISRSNGGGLPWFPGGRPNTYITQYVLQGFGQLRMMKAIDDNAELQQFYRNSLRFIETEINRRERNRMNKKQSLSPLDIHFLYITALFKEIELMGETRNNIDKWVKIAKNDWTQYSLLNKGQLAIYFNKTDDKEFAEKILESLRQTSIYKEDLGRYWKETNGYFWYQSNLEAQSMLMLAFDQVANDTEFVEELKHWLLSNKQTNKWSSTKSTTQAIYAILETGESALSSQELVTITGINQDFVQQSPIKKAVGEYNVRYLEGNINKVPASLSVTNPNPHKAWLSTSYQFVQDMDAIESYTDTPLKISRQLFIKNRTSAGDELLAVTEDNQPKIGDEIVIKLSLEVDRPMEFIHIQDSRASGTEHLSVLSTYQYSNGLYYYEETKDESTNFFIDYLPRGNYSFEYSVYASQKGDFSAGLSTIQSMYAPEFNAHSSGERITISVKK